MRVVALLLLFSGFLAFTGVAQENEVFIIEKEIKHLPVISQGSTGTCWSFATTSFLESEIIRKGFPATDLSEMFFVYFTYEEKTEQFLLYHGHNNFGEGGQAHDVMNVVSKYGMSTYEEFPGARVDDRYNHRKLVNTLDTIVAGLNKKRQEFDASNISTIEPVLQEYIGKIPQKIKTEEGRFSPDEFPEKVKINPDDYIEISSYTHHPFYQSFVLEVPDNWAHGLYYNLPIDELVEVINFSLDNGYTVCWDGDTSEKTFTHKKGKADVPKEQIGKVDQEMRQETFMNRTTTDDHLMHIVGLSKDAEGRRCYYTKNSWGAKSNDYDGYLHLTEDYVRLKTIAILVHKDAVPVNIREKLNL